MNLIDSHCHITDQKYSTLNIQELLNNAKKHNVTRIINFGVDYSDSLNVMKLAQDNDCLYFGFGCHPHEAKNFVKAQFEENFTTLRKHQKCVGIGEIGLDYYYSYSEKKIQRDVFCYFLEKAQQFQLPVSVHSRAAEEDVYEAIKDIKGSRIVLHSYTGPRETLHKLISLDVFISINGMVTFKNNQNILELFKDIPLNKLLIETDGPYLTPEPYRKEINKPEYLGFILNKLAEIKQMKVPDLANIIEQNTNTLFFS